MSQTLFVSDLHLEHSRPHIVAAFCRFLQNIADTDALYILGDLFEYWIGDDDPANGLTTAIDALREISKAGIPIYFIHGNRDFLIGKNFADEIKCKLLPEETVINLYGTPTLIMHGDTLCTDDIAYQKYRAIARNKFIQYVLLQLSVKQRLKIAEKLLSKSVNAKQNKAPEIMDVNQGAVIQAMQKHNVSCLIHGQTHRPAQHKLEINGKACTRIVLGDWYEQGSVLKCTPSAMQLETISA